MKLSSRRARPARRSRGEITAARRQPLQRIDRASPIMLFIMAVFLVTTKSKVGLCTVCLPVGLSAPCLKRVRRIEPIHGVKMAFGKVTSLGTPDSQNVLSQNCNSLRDEFVSKDFSWSIVDLTVHHEVKIFKNSHFNISIKKNLPWIKIKSNPFGRPIVVVIFVKKPLY